MKFITKWRNRFRAFRAVHRGHDTFVATDGTLRYARNMAGGETITLPAEHLPLIQDGPKE